MAPLFSLLLVASLLLSEAWSLVSPNETCFLSVFVPSLSTEDSVMTETIGVKNVINPGFSQMAAALLAVDHFNSRNPLVVPELADLQDCQVFLGADRASFYFTDESHDASQALSSSLLCPQRIPCAMVGPSHDIPARDLAVHAISMQIPHVVHKTRDAILGFSRYYPYTSQVFPAVDSYVAVLVEWMMKKGRTNYVGIFYHLSPNGVFLVEALKGSLEFYNMQWKGQSFNIDGEGKPSNEAQNPRRGLQAIQNTGFRTIIIVLDNVLNELQPVADAVQELGMNDGDYFFMFVADLDETIMSIQNKNVSKLLSGSGSVIPVSASFINPGASPFTLAWGSQGKKEVDRLNDLNPISPGQVGYMYAEDNFFQTVKPAFGSGFIYDAVMTVGLGACNAQEKSSNGTVSGKQHVDAIRKVQFTGASGDVSFGAGRPYGEGVRNDSTITYASINIQPPQSEGATFMPYKVTDILVPGRTKWDKVDVFVFSGGKTNAPRLRSSTEQNFLSDGLRIMGFTLTGIVWLAACMSIIWVFVNRKHRVTTASQPFFLYMIALGAMVQVSTIIPATFDESRGWSTEALSRACRAIPWTLSVGHIITYAALFAKLWRVNKVLQFTRVKIEVKHVLWPMAALLVAALLLLSLWAALDPLEWTRTVVDPFTGESIAQCTCEYFTLFVACTATLLLIPSVATGFMAYKTKDVDTTYAESSWIFCLIVVQSVVLFFSVPMFVILRDVSTDGRYVGSTFLVFLFPMSTLMLIILPKVFAKRRAVIGSVTDNRRRGERSGVRVTGASHPSESRADATESKFDSSLNQST